MCHGNHSVFITSNHLKKYSIPRVPLGFFIVRPALQQLFRFLLNVGEDFVYYYIWNIVRGYGHNRHMKYTGFQLVWTNWIGLAFIQVLSCQMIEIFLKRGVSSGCKGSAKTSVWYFIYLSQYQQTKSPNNSPTPYQNLLLVWIIVSLKSVGPISESSLKSVESLSLLSRAFVVLWLPPGWKVTIIMGLWLRNKPAVS